MDILERIKEQVESNSVVLYMKGTPQIPQCGFSSRTAEALKSCGHEFAYVNVLMDPEVFENFQSLPIGQPSLSCILMVSLWVDVTLRLNCMKKVSCKKWLARQWPNKVNY